MCILLQHSPSVVCSAVCLLCMPQASWFLSWVVFLCWDCRCVLLHPAFHLHLVPIPSRTSFILGGPPTPCCLSWLCLCHMCTLSRFLQEHLSSHSDFSLRHLKLPHGFLSWHFLKNCFLIECPVLSFALFPCDQTQLRQFSEASCTGNDLFPRAAHQEAPMLGVVKCDHLFTSSFILCHNYPWGWKWV